MIGIGYRKEFSEEFLTSQILEPDFVEIAPENWINLGGYWKRELKKVSEKYPIYCHGLSLSVGSSEGIDFDFLKKVKRFLDEFQIDIYSEHLSFSKVKNAHLYDLLPIPFTKDSVNFVSENIKKVQDCLNRKLIIENVSYYTVLEAEMTEPEFINEVMTAADCDLLLDVNNVFVNGFNHSYNPKHFIDQIDFSKVKYIHMAGHDKVSETLIIDTHGEDIIDPVYDLYEYTIRKANKKIPTLLERDFNIPELSELQKEIDRLRAIQSFANIQNLG